MKKGVLQKTWENCAGLGRKLADSSERDLDAATAFSVLTGHGKLVLSAPFSVAAQVIAEIADETGYPVDQSAFRKKYPKP
jgi:hypothetical protein